ncbi:MAG: DUF2723 domain-containing protein [Acidobacteriota bacterium]|nr:DUF2723 domain-containing protein [Blastocatellia bacterium]MDW8412344.1 DUF2723 domain-containing protein [Acidobacteriota bacterium]
MYKKIAALVPVVALAGYLPTYARQVTLVDSGELITASTLLGVAHPPGFPLYVLLGHIFSKLPLGSIAARLAFMSTFWAATASGVVTLLVLEILSLLKPIKTQKKKAFTLPQQVDVTVATAAGILFASSATLWYYAAVAEVYTLNSALVAVILWLIFRWRRTNLLGTPDDKLLLFAAAFYGLGLAVHHVTLILLLPAILVLVWKTNKRLFFGKKLAWICLSSLAGLAVYLYLPLAAARNPIINWGDPSSWERFYWHISGKQYQVNLFSTDADFLSREIRFFLGLISNEITPVGLVLGCYGFYLLYLRERTIFWSLLSAVIFNLLYAFNYEIAEDKDAYYLTTSLVLAISCPIAARHVYELSSKQRQVIVIAAFCLLPAVSFYLHYQRSDKSKYMIAVDLVENVMKPIGRGGLLLTADWQFYSPYLYLRHIEGFRTDATVIDVNLVRRSWYVYGYLTKEYPEMMQYCKQEVDAYMGELWSFEHDQPYDANSISKKFVAVINAFIRYHMESSRPVFSTIPMEPGVGSSLNWVPQGLVLRLYEDRIYRPEEVKVGLQLRGLTDGTVYLDDTARKKVLPFYASMFANCGIYLSLGKRYEEALEMLKQSVNLNPKLDKAYEVIGDIHREKGNKQEAAAAYRMALAINPDNKGAKDGLSRLID